MGIGASAGSLGALKTFFGQVPKDPGMAFVVVVHLSPEHESHLTELLQPHCPMPIQQVSETVALEPNCVYIIPPNANLDTIDTHLRLSSLEVERGRRTPIDHFFRTLAEMHGDHAIGIVLTGTGADGTLGLRQIQEHGGLTIAQDPQEAEYDGMPRSAIASGAVDRVLPIRDMPAYILRFIWTEPHVPITEAAEPQREERDEDEHALQKIFAYVRATTGRDFQYYKRSTIMRRMRRRMQLHQIEELAPYLDLLRSHQEEVLALADDFLITVTEFFRDQGSFAHLEKEVIPRLFENKGPEDQVRVWSVGCSSGEEAYSLAILLIEQAAQVKNSPQVRVFATDLRNSAVKKAREGVYPESIAADVSPERLRRFFTKEGSSYRIRSFVRELVTFAPHNLLRDPPFAHMDLITCRNLLIYLQRDAQRDALSIFHYALNPGGYLMLGGSETAEQSDLFSLEEKEHGLYRRRNVPARELHLPKPLFWRGSDQRMPEQPPEHRAERPVAFGATHEKMVERYAPPSLLLNEHYDIVHSSAHAGRYLQVPPGELTKNVSKLVREPLALELRAALYAARESGAGARSKPVVMEIEGQPRQVLVRVRMAEEPDLKGFFLVIFDETEPSQEAAAESEQARTNATVRELEAELDLTKRRLATAIEEYETSQEEMQASFEELQSSNEELHSTMEELETSKEELQSINEELVTANQENRHRVEELSQLTDDLRNFLAATNIPTLFLDRELRILRFTPQVDQLFSVRDTDRGRPLRDFSHRLSDNQLEHDAREVIERLTPVERELQTDEGRWYLTRVLPYRTAEDRIEGVVITFIEITRRKHAEETLRGSEEQFRVLVETSALMVWETDARGQVVADSASWRAQTGQTVQEWMGDGWLSVVHPEDREGARRKWQEAVAARMPLDNEFRVRHVDGTWRWTNVRAAPVVNEDGSVRKWVGMNIDISERKRAEEALRELNKTLESKVAQRTGQLEDRARQLAKLTLELSQTEDREHRRMADILHDDLQQQFAAMKFHLGLLSNRTAQDSSQQETIRRLHGMLKEAVETSRNLSHELSPVVLHQNDMSQTFEWLAGQMQERYGLVVHVQTRGEVNLSSEAMKAFLFKAGRELLFNVVTHAKVHEAVVRLRRSRGCVYLSVADRGRGFDPQRLKETTGFGLFSIQERVGLLGGRMRIKSAEGRGSTLLIMVPDSPEPEGKEQLPGDLAISQSPSSTPGIRVLVADDHDVVRQGLVALFREVPGIEVVGEAANGREAVDLAARREPDVIIMDVAMPLIDGYGATRQIKKHRPKIRVIALSMHDEPRMMEQMRQAGAEAYVLKTAPAEELLAAIWGKGAGEEQLPPGGAEST